MRKLYTGGCACGAIRYECDSAPMFTWICHCRECQRSTGTGGAVNVVFAASVVKFTRGQPKYHDSVGTSGQHTHRGFCPECGSPVAAKADLIPHIHGISAASLDEPGQLRVVAHIWSASAQPWDYLEPTLPRIATTPTETELAELVETVKKPNE
jgi:hypothetical protein